MLTQPQVQRYSTESGLRDIMIAEKEVVLTFLLQTAVRARHSEPAGLQGLHLLEKNLYRQPGTIFDRSGLHGDRGARS